MKYFELDPEEKKMLNEVESGRWKSIKNFKKVKKELQNAARYTLNKSKNINIRLTAKTLSMLKARAIEEGIPYQTLVSSILHKYVMRDPGRG